MDASKVGAITLSILAFVFAIVATFAPAWISVGDIYYGFFGVCFRGTCASDTQILNATVGTQASFSFMIIGTVVLLAGAILVSIGGMGSNSSTLKRGGILNILGGLFILIGAAIFAGEFTFGRNAMYSVSFGFAWIAVVFGIVGGALAIRVANN